MTEFDIQESLFDVFCSLNDFALENGFDPQGELFLNIDETKETAFEREKYTNVHFPNIPFEYPESKQYYELTFRSNEPEDSSLGKDSQSRITGVLYIDIITPQDVGEYESENKYRWIAKLFNSIDLDYIDIMKVYVSNKGNDADHYRLLVAVEWEADIDKE